MAETVRIDRTLPADILDALHTRSLCKGGLYMTEAESTEQHLDMIADIYDGENADGTPYNWQAEVRKERALLAKGQQYFAQGYRIRATAKQMRGLSFTVPADALAWRIVTAGYTAMVEQTRLQYVVKVK